MKWYPCYLGLNEKLDDLFGEALNLHVAYGSSERQLKFAVREDWRDFSEVLLLPLTISVRVKWKLHLATYFCRITIVKAWRVLRCSDDLLKRISTVKRLQILCLQFH